MLNNGNVDNFDYYYTFNYSRCYNYNYYSYFSFDPESGTCSDDEQNDTNCLYFQPILSPEAPDIYFIVIRVLGSIHTLLAIWMVIQYMGKHWDNLRFSIPIINQGM